MSVLFDHSALIAQSAHLSWYLIPLLVMAASILGSTHCLGMCGGIVMALPARRSSHLAYHLGRLGGYLLLGALAGFAGDWLLASSPVLTMISALVMGALLIAMAVRVWQGKPLHLQQPAWLGRRLEKPMALALKNSRDGSVLAGGVIGLLTIFLPCGWLYTFVLGALATHNPLIGALYLSSFWLGTLPLLALGPRLVNSWLAKRSPHQRHWVAGLFLLAGLLTIGLKSSMPLPVSAEHLNGTRHDVSCHQK